MHSMKQLSLILAGLLYAVFGYADDVTRVACIGDSITFGHGIKDRGKNSYPKQLDVLLGADFEVRNFGVSGSTLLKKGDKPYWTEGAYQKALEFNPDIVIIKLGTNDTKPQNWKFESEYISDYVEFINAFKSLEAKPQIFICTPVPVYQDRWGINESTVVEGIIPKLSEVSDQTSVKVIDLHKPLSHQPAMFPDKVHPNRDGAEVIAETVYQIITRKAADR